MNTFGSAMISSIVSLAALLTVFCVPARAQNATPLWSHTISGPVWTPLEYHEGHLFFGSDDSTFYAFDIDRRDVRWRFETGGIIRSGASVAEGLALFASDDGFLYALDEVSGAEAWRFDLGSGSSQRRLPAPDPPFDYDYAHSTPAVHGGVAYVGSATGELYAVDIVRGEEIWRFRTDGKIRSTPVIDAGTVYFGSWDGYVYAVDSIDGSLLWRFDTGGIVQGAPAIGAGKVFVGSRSATVLAIDARTGELAWKYVHEDGSWVESSAVYSEGTVYVGSSDALSLFALDSETGRQTWRFETGGWSWGTPRLTDHSVYIGSLSAIPYYFEGITLRAGFLAVDRETGTERWTFNPGSVEGYVTGGVFSAPVVVDGVVYVAGLDGRLYAFRE